MNASSYTAIERRAANQIWTAAERYDFEPLFLAIHRPEGEPDFYMNLVMGLSYKYCSGKKLCELFELWKDDIHQEMLDSLTWLYLENIVYRIELPVRPVLKELRISYAKDFFAGEYKLSRQEWMSKNHLVYDLLTARWNSVLGRKTHILTPTERNLYQALTPTEAVSVEKISETLVSIYRKFLLFDGKKHVKKPLKLHVTGIAAKLLARLRPVQLEKTDRVVVMRSTQSETQQEGFLQNKGNSHIVLKKEAADRVYIESCFGRSLYQSQDLARTEKEICTGNHTGCHVWITDGKVSPGIKMSAENCYLIGQAQIQRDRNKEYYYRNQKLHSHIITYLTEQIRNCMLVHQQQDVLPGRSGSLDVTRVWRAKYVNDTRVFHSRQDDMQLSFTVDLLLDASASRLQHQEMIAAQGMILGESLHACMIPVRISEYCSVRGYTVLRVLKRYEDKKCASVFKYFASGWNRDGLVMRLMDKLLKYAPGPAEHHLVIFLTDAEPNDSFRMQPVSGAPFGHDYSDDAAVMDTAAEVSSLRQKGIHVSAVFMGRDSAVSKADKIYGKDYKRIRDIGQLAEVAGTLIQNEIRKINH